MKRQSKLSKIKRVTIVLLIIYLIAMLWILVFKLGVRFSYMEMRKVNLIPFDEPSVISEENILNVLIFIPPGIYIATLFRRWGISKKLFSLFLLSLIVEAVQYVFRFGAFDVTDIITNTSGGVMGLIIFKTISSIFNDRVKTQKFINIAGAFMTTVMVLLLLLLKMNMLPVRYQ